MENFRDRDIVLSLDEAYGILEKQKYAVTTLRKFEYPIEKISILYELGIIGLEVDEAVKRHENLKNNVCFNYTEGLEPLDILKKKKISEKVKVVINPAFKKVLSLNFNAPEIIENYSWKYLYNNHARKSIIRRI